MKIQKVRKKKYIQQYAALKNEWDIGLNKSKMHDPDLLRVTHKYWWRCSKNKAHTWQGLLMHRLRGSGCPYCAGKLVDKTNSLATCLPKLTKEWHPTKNSPLDPSQVTVGSKLKIWWQCSKYLEHEWLAAIFDRSKGSKCPYCANQKVDRSNSLATTNPKLAKEWHPIKNGSLLPSDFVAGSKRKIWWICSKNKSHEWLSAITDRSGGHACPYCSGNKAATETSLAALAPSIAKEWHPSKNGRITANDVTLGSKLPIFWKCKNGHVWKDRVLDRAHGYHCRKCLDSSEHKMQMPKKEFDQKLSLANFAPEIAADWHPTKNEPLRPKDMPISTRRRVWWLCLFGHEWPTSVAHRMKGSNCPKCTRQTTKPELRLLTELRSMFPKIQHRQKVENIECDLFLPDEKVAVMIDGWFFHKGTQKKDIAKSRVLSAAGYTVLRVRGSKLKQLENSVLYDEDYGVRHKDIVALLALLLRLMPVSKSDSISKYCLRGSFVAETEYLSEISNIPLPKSSVSFATFSPEMAKWWHPTLNGRLKAIHVTPKSSLKIWWRCPRGHEFQGIIGDRSRGIGCPYCSGMYTALEDSLMINNKKLMREWDYERNTVSPKQISEGSNYKAWWKCKKNPAHLWQATISNRSGNETGCPFCSGNKVSDTNSLAETFPEIAKEWNREKNGDLSPKDVTAFSKRAVWWLCSANKKHEWLAVIGNRTGRKSGCPLCYKARRKKSKK